MSAERTSQFWRDVKNVQAVCFEEGFPPTQDQAARAFIHAFGHELRWVQDERSWYIASRTSRPGLWSREDREGTALRMQAVVEVAQNFTGKTGPSGTARFMTDALRLARAPLAARSADFNADPNLLATPNGVVDLRDGLVREIRNDDLLTVSTSASYDPEAECPRWLDHLRVLTRLDAPFDARGDGELTAYLQELVGVSLFGTQREHAVIFLHGSGGNGKDVFDGTIRRVLGAYADVMDQTILFSRADAHTTGLTDLFSRRYVSANELDGRKQLNTGLLKKLSGGSTVKARRMRQDNFAFEPSHTMWLISNDVPNFGADESEGLWRRVIVIETGPTIPDTSKVADESIRQVLEAEGPGILRWAVEGAVRYHERGKLPTRPRRVQAATEQLSSESRLMRRFLEESYTPAGDGKLLLRAVTTEYEQWLRDEGELGDYDKVPTKEVANKLRQEGVKVAKSTGNKSYVYGLAPVRVTEPLSI